MLRTLTALLLLATQFAAEKPFVRAQWNEATLRITYKNKVMRYSFNDPERAKATVEPYKRLFLYSIDKAKTDFLTEVDGTVYLLMDVYGPSRGPQAATSMCGAGEERAKVLFVFDAKGEINPPQIALYESCLASIGAIDPEKESADTRGKVIQTITYIRHAEPYNEKTADETDKLITVKVLFDEDHPERGMQFDESCILHAPWLKSNERVVCLH